MNILFLYSETIEPQVGGVERVTYVLAKYFETKGNVVFFLGLNRKSSPEDGRQYFLPVSSSPLADENIIFYRSFLLDKGIDVVINQGGTNPIISKLAYDCKKIGVKLISVVHNSLLAPVKNYSSIHKVQFRQKNLDWLLPLTDTIFIKNILLRLYRTKYSKHYKSLCAKSDYVFLLSDSFKEELSFFLAGQSMNNVIGMPNPTSFDMEISTSEKKKELLYVGRINTSQKRVDLLLKIWGLLHEKHADWSLKIVGDGDELDSIKKLSSSLNLKNIYFYGFKDPRPFYETASIFCMTSAFEGFSLTLIEAMQFSVIPFAFHSFPAVTDIIDDRVNGCLIRPFSINEYADKLSGIMYDEAQRMKYSVAAHNKAKLFTQSIIGEKWMDIFKKLHLID